MSKYLDDLKAAFDAGFPVYYYGSLLKDPSWSGWEYQYYMVADDRSAWESYKKQQEQQENCMSSGHKHAALMVEYAKDAAKTDKPWLLWEYKCSGKFYPLTAHPSWSTTNEYRRKPEQSDLEKYGVEVGDVWLMDEKIKLFVGGVTKKLVTVQELESRFHLTYNVNVSPRFETLIFRRGVVNKL